MSNGYSIVQGDVLERLREMPADSVQCVVTSPPYWGLRDYKCAGQIGLEKTVDEYVAKMVEVFAEVRRVLAKDGTLWLNLGDAYDAGTRKTRTPNPDADKSKHGYWANPNINHRVCANLKPKDLIGLPWRVAFALQAEGWWLRSDIVWSKKNPMPESVTDRPTRAHEYIFLMTKYERYFYNAEAIKERCTYSNTENTPGTGVGWNKSDIGDVGNGRKKRAVTDKQRGYSRRHAGFNERWDKMTKAEQCGARKRDAMDDRILASASGRMGREEGWRETAQPMTRNKRSVWNVATEPCSEAHFATFPTRLIEPCVLAGSRPGDVVLDPFCGSGTTMIVAVQHGRVGLGIELNADYIAIAHRRIAKALPLFAVVNE